MVLFLTLLYLFLIPPQIAELEADFQIASAGFVTDFIIEDDVLYAATDQGIVDVFSITERIRSEAISIPDLTDFMGDTIPAKIFSIDKLIGIEDLLIVSQGAHGFRNVDVIKHGKINRIFHADKDKLMITDAVYVSNRSILIATISNEMILYDLENIKIIYKEQISLSAISDFKVDLATNAAAISDEAGKIFIIEINTGEVLETISAWHKDNVYSIDYKNNMLIGGGKDKKVSVVSLRNGEGYFLQQNFPVYAVAMDQNSRRGAYLSIEENEINIFDIGTRESISRLKGPKTMLTKMQFISDNLFVASAEEPIIYFWKF